MTCALLCGAATAPVAAQTAPAGTTIANTARAQFTIDGVAQTTASNTVSLIVAERLDVTLAPATPGAVAAADAVLPVGFVVTDTGNGADTFTLLPTADRGTEIVGVAVDSDGDGRYDPARDTPLANATTAMLAPGASIRLLVIVDAPAGAAPTALTLTATATTGTGTPGRTLPGAGDNGGDAVIGATGATASATTPFTADAGAPTLTKSQAVRAPDGSATPIRGAIVTYTLAARFTGAAGTVRIDDAVPAGTTYVAASLTLDAAPLSDAADADAGTFDGTAIHVVLGDIAAAATRTIQFQVRIQ